MPTVRLLSIAAMGCAIACPGCTDPAPGSQLPARFEATIDEHQLDVSIWLWRSTNGLAYEVAPDEHVEVAFRDQVVDCVFRARVDPYYYPPYLASFALTDEVEADETVTLTLTRGDEELVHVVGTAPAPFTLDAPATAPYQTELTVRWSPTSTDPMSWMAYGDADVSEGPIREDAGELTFPWEALGDPGLDVDLEFHRVRGVESSGNTARTTITQTRSAHIRFGT